MTRNTTTFIYALATTLICILLTVSSQQVSQSIEKSIDVCLSSIIPSLFAFMVFSQIMISSGIADVLFYPLYWISRFWFKGGSREFAIFMLSLIGGYPVGIKLLKDNIAYNKNYPEMYDDMLCYCYCGSPSFIIQVTGISLLESQKAGLIIYFSNVLACFVMAVIINLFAKRKLDYYIPPKNVKITLKSVTDSITSSVKSLGVICGTIIVFNVCIELLDFVGFMDFLSVFGAEKIFASFFEISNISLFKGNNYALLPLFAGITSFGGLCIILQTAAISEGKLKLRKFIAARIPAAILSALICGLLSSVFGIVAETSATIQPIYAFSSINPICSICIIMSTYIIIKMKNSREK